MSFVARCSEGLDSRAEYVAAAGFERRVGKLALVDVTGRWHGCGGTGARHGEKVLVDGAGRRHW